MSTYLLAMVVGEYDYIETKDSDGVLIRVYTPLGKKEQGAFALSVCSSLKPIVHLLHFIHPLDTIQYKNEYYYSGINPVEFRGHMSDVSRYSCRHYHESHPTSQ